MIAKLRARVRRVWFLARIAVIAAVAYPAALAVLLWQRMPKRVRRLECRLRKEHRCDWAHGYWTCDRCGARTKGAPPPGTHLTDEGAEHIYKVGERGELRRVDKVRGGKKVRRKNRVEVQRLEAMRKAMLADEEIGG